jgi:hypothetical protein
MRAFCESIIVVQKSVMHPVISIATFPLPISNNYLENVSADGS